ncbi:MAG: hypothetical protein ABIF85_04565 [Nanoarchaeota archaeon]|nr:hypothetical protein [Nanoarchaeota archaeon]MBU4452470.1 hypothetical protein [Nanoarchaeota archaeon]MCG2724000.1 hypothetical protein [archaeon]
MRSSGCIGKEICMFSSYSLNDSHIAQCGYYGYSACCDLKSATLRGSLSLRANCLANEEGIAALYDANDTHVELYSNGNFNYTLCVTPHVRCSKKPACGENETAIFSVFNSTDSHIGTPDYYSDKICCLDQAPKIISLGTYHVNGLNIEYAIMFNRTDVVMIRANITDSSGAEDIDTALVTIRSPLNGTRIYLAPMANISSIENGTMYEYNFTRTRFARLGNWSVNVWANDSFGNTTTKDIYFEITRNSSELWVVNSLINVVFSPNGISSLELNDSELLEEGIDLLTYGLPNVTLYPTVAKIDYANGVFLKIYDQLSKIVVYSNHSFSPVINLNSTFTNYYNDSENTFNGSGEQFSNILNMTSIYTGTRTVTIIGKDLNVSVYNTTHKEIRLYNVTEFEIYVHPGTYETSLAEKNMYLNPPATLIGLPALINGIADKRIEELASLTRSEIQQRIGSGISYNITIENKTTSIGGTIPDDRDVIVVSRPMTLIGRLGNITKTYMNIALWIGDGN